MMCIIYLVVDPTNRKWVTTLVINGISGVSPLTTGVITHLLSGMNHQVYIYMFVYLLCDPFFGRKKVNIPYVWYVHLRK